MISLFLFILLIGLFISGMALLRTGLFQLSANSLKKWLVLATDTPLKGVIIGTLITAVLQSSSAVMIITIGMVSARILTFPQSIGIILGTNIGTTLTAEFITFNMESFLIPMSAAGFLLALFKQKNLRSTGLILLGISVVFTAMTGFEFLAAPLKSLEWVLKLLLTLDENRLYAVLTGILLTAIIQSSTAATGIIMGFLTVGTMHLETGIAILLGTNIGTCVDALLASLGSGKEAKLAAYAHIWLNILGVALFYPFIGFLSSAGIYLADQPDVQLAHVSVIFNIVTSLLVLPFAHSFGKMIMNIHGDK